MLSSIKRSVNSPAESKFSDRRQRIYDFLNTTPVGVLSTVSPDNEPHGVVIYFSVDQDFKLSFLTRDQTRKYDNLKHDNHLMLTVFDPLTQTTAQILGKATEITDGYKIYEVAAATIAASQKTSESGLPPISKLEAGDYVAFRIDPVQITMAVYARPGVGDYNDLFESVESFELNS